MCWLCSFCPSFPIHSTPARGPQEASLCGLYLPGSLVLWHPDGFGQWGTCLVVRRWEEGKVRVFISQLLPYLTAVLTVMGFSYRHSPGQVVFLLSLGSLPPHTLWDLRWKCLPPLVSIWVLQHSPAHNSVNGLIYKSWLSVPSGTLTYHTTLFNY